MNSRCLGPSRVLLALGLSSVLVCLLAAVAAREWIVDRYYLSRLEHPLSQQNLEYLWYLVQRKRAAVTPHLLRYYQENPVSWFSPEEGTSDRVASLISLGPDAVPYLAKSLQDRSGDPEMVFDALAKLGPRSRGALPEITDYLKREREDERTILKALESIAAMAEAAHSALPSLLTLRRYDNDLVRRGLYRALEAIGPRANGAVPVLLDAIEYEGGENLLCAARALERIDSGRTEVVSALIACVETRSDQIVTDAAAFLVELGPRAGDAIPALFDLIAEDPDPDLLLAAARAMDRLDPARGFQCSLERFHRSSGAERRAACYALAGFGSRTAEASSALLEAAVAPDKLLAAAAFESLALLGASASPVMPRIIEIMSAQLSLVKADDRHGLSKAFARLASRNPAMQSALVAALARDRDTQVGAIMTLARIGRAAAEALPALRRLAADRSDPELAGEAHDAIRRMEGE